MQDSDIAVADRLSHLAVELLATIPAAEPFLRDWPTTAPLRPQRRSRLPVLGYLDRACALATPTTAPFVEALAQTAATLDWGQTYAVADIGSDFLDRYGWTELVGLRGPLPSETIACGVLMLGPGADYPLHAHEAEELYLPLAGRGLWKRDDAAFVAQPPGTPIHHPSFMPHAMRTEAEPMLALYLWRGDGLGAKARLLPPS